MSNMSTALEARRLTSLNDIVEIVQPVAGVKTGKIVRLSDGVVVAKVTTQYLDIEELVKPNVVMDAGTILLDGSVPPKITIAGSAAVIGILDASGPERDKTIAEVKSITGHEVSEPTY